MTETGKNDWVSATRDMGLELALTLPQQGPGMLQSWRELVTDRDYCEKFGFRELRTKLNEKAKFRPDNDYQSPYQPKAPYEAIRLAIGADYCYGTDSAKIARAYLDSGPLAEEFKTFLDGRCLNSSDIHKLLTLSASVMTIGCAIPAEVIQMLEKMVTPAYQLHTEKVGAPAFRTAIARGQMKQAIISYKAGTPYSFGNASRNATEMTGKITNATAKMIEIGNTKVTITILPSGDLIPQIIGPPNDESLGVQPIHPIDVCAGCGKDEGDRLMLCASCKDRRYCSKECQKKHWKLHKPICSRPKAAMDKFLDSVPLDFGMDSQKARDKRIEKLFGKAPVHMNMNVAKP